MLTLPASVVELFRLQKAQQDSMRQLAGKAWTENNLVFTNPLGDFLPARTVYNRFKRVVAEIGAPSTRFHDLRHPNVKPKTQIFYIQSINPRTLSFSVLGFMFCEYLILQIYSSCHKFESGYNYISNFDFN